MVAPTKSPISATEAAKTDSSDCSARSDIRPPPPLAASTSIQPKAWDWCLGLVCGGRLQLWSTVCMPAKGAGGKKDGKVKESKKESKPAGKKRETEIYLEGTLEVKSDRARAGEGFAFVCLSCAAGSLE